MDVSVYCVDGTRVDLPNVGPDTVDLVLDQLENGGSVLKFALKSGGERIVYLARHHVVGIEVSPNAEP